MCAVLTFAPLERLRHVDVCAQLTVLSCIRVVDMRVLDLSLSCIRVVDMRILDLSLFVSCGRRAFS